MHPLYRRAHELSGVVIGAAIEVHRTLGPGLLESIYERCLVHELSLRGVPCVSQQLVRVRYKDIAFNEVLKFDVAVDDCLLVEVKAVQEVHPVHKAQTLSYMRLLDFPLGLILEFSRAPFAGWSASVDPSWGWKGMTVRIASTRSKGRKRLNRRSQRTQREFSSSACRK